MALVLLLKSPSMEITLNEQFFNMVAEELARDFMPALQNLGGKRNFYYDVGSVAEILEWAADFREQYLQKHLNGSLYGSTEAGLDIDPVLRSLIRAFGRDRLLRSYTQNNCLANAFNEKYLSL
jgi:hypothetical protein